MRANGPTGDNFAGLYGGGSGGGGSAAVDTDFTCDAAGRVTGISHTAEAQTLADYTVTWDPTGQRVGEISTSKRAGHLPRLLIGSRSS